MRRILVLAVLLLCAGACLAQGFGNQCTPAGTWYGGSAPAKYLMTIVPGRAGHFITVGQAAFKPNPAAAAVLTQYHGDLAKEEGTDRYVGHSIAIANLSDAFPLPWVTAYPQVWAVEEYFTMPDCNTLNSTITFFGVYKWENLETVDPQTTPAKIPFVSPPDSVRNGIPPATATEVYHRVPTTCKQPDVCPVFLVQ